MPARSALLRAIRKFLARQRREARRGEGGESEGDATRNFVGLAIPRNRRRRSNKQLFPPAFTLVLALPPSPWPVSPLPVHPRLSAAVPLARYLPRSIGRSVYCFKRESSPPPTPSPGHPLPSLPATGEMFSRSSCRASSGRLSTNNPQSPAARS